MSNINDSEFTIRVRGAPPPPPAAKKGGKSTPAPPPAQRRYNLRLRPSSSLEQMRSDVCALFDVPSGLIGAYQLSFLGGFPPQELDQIGKDTVHELGIRANECLIVKFALAEGSASGAAAAAAANEPAADEAAPAAASVGNRRKKRAAAAAATASFKDVIAAQDAMMKQGKQSLKKRASKKTKKAKMEGAGYRLSDGKSLGNTAASKKPKKDNMEGAGYRLSDGKSFAGSSPSKKSGGSNRSVQALFQGHGDVAQGEGDIANKVLSSLAGGGKGGKVGSFLRSAMKGALEKLYEASRANVRVAAVNQGEFSFEKAKEESVDKAGMVLGAANQQLGMYTVSYSKGMEGRGRYEEEMQIYGAVAVKSVLHSVYKTAHESGEEDTAKNPNGDTDGRLRPALIAQLSPRIFWSLIYHCSEGAKNIHNPTPVPTSVDDMLRSTLPELDWSHLDRGGRKRVLSEKAQENLRQKACPSEATTDQQCTTLLPLVVGIVEEGYDVEKAEHVCTAVDSMLHGLLIALARMNHAGVVLVRNHTPDSIWFATGVRSVTTALFHKMLEENKEVCNAEEAGGANVEEVDNKAVYFSKAGGGRVQPVSLFACIEQNDEDLEMLREADVRIRRVTNEILLKEPDEHEHNNNNSRSAVLILNGILLMIYGNSGEEAKLDEDEKPRDKVIELLTMVAYDESSLKDESASMCLSSTMLKITANVLLAKQYLWEAMKPRSPLQDRENHRVDCRLHCDCAAHLLRRMHGEIEKGEFGSHVKVAYKRLASLLCCVELEMNKSESSDKASLLSVLRGTGDE